MRLLFLCIVLFTGYAAKAQAAKTPDKLQGNWSLPDCRVHEEALLVTRGFTLHADKEGARLAPLGDAVRYKDYWAADIEGKTVPFRIEADGVLKIGRQTPPGWAKTWDGLGLDSRDEYTRCDDIPATLPDPLVRAVKALDAVAEACRDSFTEACARGLFKAADENRNGRLSPSEIKHAGQAIAALAEVAGGKVVPNAVLDKAVYQSMVESDRLAGNKDFSFEDIRNLPHSTLLDEARNRIAVLMAGIAVRNN